MMSEHKGSTFDSFLEEEGLLGEAEAAGLKKVISYEIEQAMKEEHLTKSKMAEKLHTSRSSLERLLDPENTSITLRTLVKVNHILKKKLLLSFV